MSKRTLLPLLLVPIAVGCGSSKPTPTTVTDTPQNPAASAYAYARCMRSHGVTSFPDPKVSISPGHASVAFRVDPTITGAPKFKSADKTCSKLLPAPTTPDQQRAHDQAKRRYLLAFARCLRANGVHDFPDPNAQGQLHLQTVIAAGVDIHSRGFLDAAKACVGVTGGAITMSQIEAGINGQQG